MSRRKEPRAIGSTVRCYKCDADVVIDTEKKAIRTSHLCRPCNSDQSKAWRDANPEKMREARARWDWRNPGANRKQSREYYRENAGTINEKRRSADRTGANESMARWRARNPEKVAAHNAVHAAKQRGDIVTAPCLKCDDANSHAHHPDYSSPLDVVWLCAKHHAAEHMREKEES